MRAENNIAIELRAKGLSGNDRHILKNAALALRELAYENVVNGNTSDYKSSGHSDVSAARGWKSFEETVATVNKMFPKASESSLAERQRGLFGVSQDLMFRAVIIDVLDRNIENVLICCDPVNGQIKHKFLNDIVMMRQLRIWAQGSMLVYFNKEIAFFDAEIEKLNPTVLSAHSREGSVLQKLRAEVNSDTKHFELQDAHESEQKECFSATDMAIARLIVDKIKQVGAQQVDRHLMEWLQAALDEGRVSSELSCLGTGKLTKIGDNWFFGTML